MMRKLMLPTLICLLTICGPYFFPQQQAAPDNKDTTVLPGGRIGDCIDVVNAKDEARSKRFPNEENGELSGAKARVGNGASPVGAKGRLGNTVDAKVIGGLRPFATGPRGPFTGEGRMLTEGRIFAMSTDDLDRDGRSDIVVSDFLNPARVLWNDAARAFTRVLKLTATPETATEGHGVAIADFNGDRMLDLFLVYNGRPSRLLFGDGKGGFTDSGRSIGEPGLNGTSVTAADVDGDGDLDALVSHFQQADLIYLNNGKGTFTVSPQALEGNAVLGDVDGDGDPDAVCVPGGGEGPASIWLNTKGHFARQDAMLDIGEGIASLSLADFSGDRALDLVVLGRSAKTTLWKNNGRGGFQKLGPSLESGTRMSVGDIDLDGDPDLVVGNVVWLNIDGSRFENVQALDLGDLPTAMCLTDIDNDGDLDLLANRGSRALGRTELLLFENTLRRPSVDELPHGRKLNSKRPEGRAILLVSQHDRGIDAHGDLRHPALAPRQ